MIIEIREKYPYGGKLLFMMMKLEPNLGYDFRKLSVKVELSTSKKVCFICFNVRAL